MSYSKVMKYFKDISAIPHPSGHTEGIQKYLEDFALSNSLEYKKDKVGNVVIYKKGTKNTPALILQSHMDMVWASEDKTLDKTTTPIELVEVDSVLKANGTTLGADNGIGMAYMLAILSNDKIETPPLECLFTVDEETGMDGATELGDGMISAKRMINLDSEDEGEILSSSAGGAHILSNVSVKFALQKNVLPLRVKVFGVTGGHSGQEIYKRGANAIIVMRDILSGIKKEKFNLVSFESINAYNVIPKETSFVIATDPKDAKQIASCIQSVFNSIKVKYLNTDPDIDLSIEFLPVSETVKCIDKKSFSNFIKYFDAFQNGVIEYSKEDSDKVITSLNTAVVRVDDEESSIFIGASIRSNDDIKRDMTILKYVSLSRSMGYVTTVVNSVYPSWKEVPSPLREHMKAVYKKMYKKDMVEKSIHAGLECGYFAQKTPNMDIASIGPDIRCVHTTKEYAVLDSVKRVYSYLKKVIEEI